MSLFEKIKCGFKDLPFIVHVLYFLLAVTFCYLYFQKIVINADFSAVNSISAVGSFNTAKPYQFRVLLPLIFKLFSPLTFLSAKAIYMGLNCIIVYLTLLVYYHLLKKYFDSKAVCILLAPAILYPMVWNYIILNGSFQYYDLAAVFFFTLGLYCILSESFAVFAIVFTLAILNKESSVYLIFAYLLYNYKVIFTKKIIFNTGVLAAIFLIIKLGMFFIFKSNSGDTFEIGLPVNIDIVTNLYHNRIYAKHLGLSFGMLYIFVLLLFISGRWKTFTEQKSKPMVLINLAFVPYLLLGIFMIYFTEVRVYAELIPMFTTLSLIYISSFFKVSSGPHDNG